MGTLVVKGLIKKESIILVSLFSSSRWSLLSIAPSFRHQVVDWILHVQMHRTICFWYPIINDLSESSVMPPKWLILNLTTSVCQYKSLGISRQPWLGWKPYVSVGCQKESIKKAGLYFYGASAQSYGKSLKIWFSHLGKKWSCFSIFQRR